MRREHGSVVLMKVCRVNASLLKRVTGATFTRVYSNVSRNILGARPESHLDIGTKERAQSMALMATTRKRICTRGNLKSRLQGRFFIPR